MLVDMNEFKADFANLIAELESTEETNKTEPVQVKKIKQKEKVQKILDNKIIQSEKVLSFRKGIIAASVGFAIGFGVLLKSIR